LAPGAAPHVVVLEPYNGGLAFARSLVRAGIPVTLILTDELSWMSRARGVRAIRVPGDDPQQRYPAILSELAEEGPALLISGSADRPAEWLAEHRAGLPPSLLTFEGPSSGHLDLLDKDRAYDIAVAAGVTVPWTRTVTPSADVAAVAAEAPYPCVVKPVLSHVFRDHFGQERVFLVDDAAAAVRAARAPLDAGLEMLFSEYVPGGDGDVSEAIVVRTADGTYPVSFGCRKIRQHPRGFGAASICVSDPIPESMELARALLDGAGFTGVVGVETKRHAVTGRTYFIEANVRLPTQFGIGDAAGADASRRLVATLAGEPLGPPPVPRAGVKLVFPELEAPAALGLLRDTDSGRAALAWDLLRSYRGTRELGLLDPRDPGPLLSRCARFVRRRLRRGPA
jgi:predicted ATP-grasp superfamily ATP-dependent carboligase